MDTDHIAQDAYNQGQALAMNAAVALDQQSPATGAHQFLVANHLA